MMRLVKSWTDCVIESESRTDNNAQFDCEGIFTSSILGLITIIYPIGTHLAHVHIHRLSEERTYMYGGLREIETLFNER
jgi:hypothetical protein